MEVKMAIEAHLSTLLTLCLQTLFPVLLRLREEADVLQLLMAMVTAEALRMKPD